MPSIAEMRAKFPQYNDLSDQQLADGVYRKFYSDMPRADFDAKLGTQPAPAPEREYGGMLPISWEKGKKAETWEFDRHGGITGPAFKYADRMADALKGEMEVGEDGRTSPGVIQDAIGTAAVISPATPALRAGEGIAGAINLRKPTSVTPPTAAQLKTAGGEGFNSARAASEGMRYNPRVTSRMGDFFTGEMKRKGYNREGSKQTYTIIDEYFKGGNAPTTYDEFLVVKDALQKVRMDFKNPADKEAAEFILERIYKFVETADPRTVMAGTAPATGTPLIGADAGRTAIRSAQEVAKQNAAARANYAAAKRSEFLSGKLDRAERQAAAANSGLNLDNTIRQRANDILNRDKLQTGYTKAELKLLRRVVDGDKSTNTLRFAANILGGGGGLGMSVGGTIGAAGGAALGGPLGAAIGAIGAPAVGYGLKKGGGALTRKTVRKIDTATRMRSPLYQEMLLNAPMEPMATGLPSAAVRGGLAASPSVLDMLFQREKN
jgi:hypothetical protein